MVQTAANVLAGKPLTTGGVLNADLGATLPTTAVAASTGFTALGYVGEDGVTEGGERTTEKVKAWGGDIVKVLQTDHSLTYSFTFIETVNADVLETVYGNVTTTAATVSTGTLHAVDINGDQLSHKMWVIDVKDGLARVRIAIPDGQVTEVGEVTYSDGAVIGYPVTIECFPDTSGNKAYKYVDDGVFSA